VYVEYAVVGIIHATPIASRIQPMAFRGWREVRIKPVTGKDIKTVAKATVTRTLPEPHAPDAGVARFSH
jgi:hypothetical protein